MTSQNFSSKRLSFDSLKVRERCGLISLAAHRRCTLAGEIPAARAIVRQLPPAPSPPARSLKGHEERFPPTRLSAGCGFRKETQRARCAESGRSRDRERATKFDHGGH